MINTPIKSFHRVPNQQAVGARETMLIMLDYITALPLHALVDSPLHHPDGRLVDPYRVSQTTMRQVLSEIIGTNNVFFCILKFKY